MDRASDLIERPAAVPTRDLREMSKLNRQRSSTSASEVSVKSDFSTSTYESYRRDEKARAEVHASGGAWIELFYDLFFAASLSAYSNSREISSHRDLVDLAAFFSMRTSSLPPVV